MASTRRPYGWEFELMLAPAAYEQCMHRGSADMSIRWDCVQDDAYHRWGFSGQGWHWARFPETGRIHMRRFKELQHLSDPADVADADGIPVQTTSDLARELGPAGGTGSGRGTRSDNAGIRLGDSSRE